MPVYKVSIVITGGDHPGAIMNLKEKPEVGEVITLNHQKFKIKEVIELMPPRGDFHFLHLTCSPTKG